MQKAIHTDISPASATPLTRHLLPSRLSDADYREDEEEIVLPDGEPEPDAARDEDAERKAYQTSDGYEDV